MDHLLLQKQFHDNSEDVNAFTNSLKAWEQEMKSKDEELLKLTSQKMENENSSIEEKTLEHEEADSHKTKGNDLVKGGKWKEALEEYSHSISLYPNDAVYYGNRSYCYLQLNNLEAAEKDCNLALQLKPNYVKVALRRAKIRKNRGDIQGAAKDYNLILILEPKNTVALKEYEEIYPELKKYFNEVGVPMHEFVETNPSVKVAQENEAKYTDNVSNSQKKGITKPLSKSIKFSEENLCNITKSQEPEIKNLNGDYAVILPEKHKPPHLRSKLPLRRITIEDIYLNWDNDFAIS